MKVKLDKRNIILLLGTIILFLLLFETILRLYPIILGKHFANSVLTKYHSGIGGIYEYDAELRMNFMKPNFSTIMYFNGYEWEHKTDSLGFRNPSDRDKADIVLLGDSLIYGHGVDQNQTIAHFLEQKNYTVMNLARQGDSAFQEAYLLNKYGLSFKPKFVFYFFYNNDINDLFHYLSKEEMKDFIRTPIEDISFKDRRISDEGNVIKPYYKQPFIIKALKFVISKRKDHNKYMNASLGINYTKHAILQMNYASDSNNVKFVIVPLVMDYGKLFRNEKLEILREFTFKHNVSFIDTTGMNDSRYYLANDGHFNEGGHKKIANIIEQFLIQGEK